MKQLTFSFIEKKEFSYKEILEYCKKHKIRTPAYDLVGYGIKCNWLTKKGLPFKTLAAFVDCYNSVWLKKYRDTDKGYWRNK